MWKKKLFSEGNFTGLWFFLSTTEISDLKTEKIWLKLKRKKMKKTRKYFSTIRVDSFDLFSTKFSKKLSYIKGKFFFKIKTYFTNLSVDSPSVTTTNNAHVYDEIEQNHKAFERNSHVNLRVCCHVIRTFFVHRCETIFWYFSSQSIFWKFFAPKYFPKITSTILKLVSRLSIKKAL